MDDIVDRMRSYADGLVISAPVPGEQDRSFAPPSVRLLREGANELTEVRAERDAAVKVAAVRQAVLNGLLAACKGLVSFAEECEVKIDGEWGCCRGLGKLYADGAIHESIMVAMSAIQEAEGL